MPLGPLGLLALALTLAMFIHVATMAVVARLVGIKPSVVKFGSGRAILGSDIGGTRVDVGWFPFAGSVNFADAGNGQDGLSERGLPQRIAVALSGCLLLIAIAQLLSPQGAIEIARNALSWCGSLLSSPANTMSVFWRDALSLAANAPLSVVFGTVAGTVGVLNLLPVPALNGGAVALWLLGAMGVGERTRDVLVRVGMALLLLLATLAIVGTLLALRS